MTGAAESGLDAARLARLDDFARSLVADGTYPGVALLVWHRGDVRKVAIGGAADIAGGKAFARDTIVRIASMTKPVVSAAALILIERGRIALDDPIARWLPEMAGLRVLRCPDAALDDTVPAIRAPTLHDLLTHRAGFTGGFGPPSPLSVAVADAIGPTPFITRDPDDFVGRIAALPLLLQPGARWHYGISTDLLGVIVARAGGTDLPGFLRREIFEPLAMTDTGFHVPADRLPRFAAGYARTADASPALHDDAATGRWSTPPVFPSGGGGLVSTLDDYLRFARMLLSGGTLDGVRILSRHAVAAMTRGQLTSTQREPLLPAMDILDGRNFGLGVSVREAWTGGLGSSGTYGWPGVYGTDWFNDPGEQLIGVALTQVWFGGGALRSRFANLVYQALR